MIPDIKKYMLYCVYVTLFVPNMHSEVLLELLDKDLSFNENGLNVCQTQHVQFYKNKNLISLHLFFSLNWDLCQVKFPAIFFKYITLQIINLQICKIHNNGLLIQNILLMNNLIYWIIILANKSY